MFGMFFKSGMPDGLFSNQKSQFGKILEGPAMQNVVIFYVHLVYFMAIVNISWPFGIFSPVLVCCKQLKSGNPACNRCFDHFF
jgi:hypothetical protein